MARNQKPKAAAPPKVKEDPSPASERRASKRLRQSDSKASNSRKFDAKKSVYWEGNASQTEGDDGSSSAAEGSGYDDEDANESSAAASSSAAPSVDSEEERPGKRRKLSQPQKKKTVAQPTPKANGARSHEGRLSVSAKELLKEGVRTGLEPGKEVIIKAIRARDDGGIPYTPSTIHPNTMIFLEELKKDNDREWLKAHDAIFRQAEQDWKSFLEGLSARTSEVDPTIPELPVKDLIYRIYRDVRFSPDKTPYKTNFSAYFSRTGRKGPYAGYYIQIAPKGHSLVAGGLWCPEAPKIRAVRRNIDRHPDEIKSTLLTPQMRRDVWDGEIKAGDNKAVVRTFANLDVNLEYKLKTRPKDYEATHPEIELLKLKSFIVMKRLPDIEVVGMGEVGLMEKVLRLISAFQPFVEHMNRLVMPDPGHTPSGSEDESEENDA